MNQARSSAGRLSVGAGAHSTPNGITGAGPRTACAVRCCTGSGPWWCAPSPDPAFDGEPVAGEESATAWRSSPEATSGYFVCSSGNVTDEMIAEYVESQGAEPKDDRDFTVE